MEEYESKEFYRELRERYDDIQNFISERDKDGEFFTLMAVGRYVEGEVDDSIEMSFATNIGDEEELDDIMNSLYTSINTKLDEPKSVNYWIRLFGGDPDKYLN
jgi:hypothetical protein